MINLVGQSKYRHIVNQANYHEANLVLEDTVERIYHGSAFGQTHHGVFIIRGENVVLIGQVVSNSFYLGVLWLINCSGSRHGG
jgi:U6 snRNA-associated Sm-like protein LSm1